MKGGARVRSWILLAVVARANAQEKNEAPSNAKLVWCARLADVKAGKVLKDRAIWIDEDRIREVGTIETVRKHAPPKVEEINLGNVTILPGLIDCHTHLLRL